MSVVYRQALAKKRKGYETIYLFSIARRLVLSGKLEGHYQRHDKDGLLSFIYDGKCFGLIRLYLRGRYMFMLRKIKGGEIQALDSNYANSLCRRLADELR